MVLAVMGVILLLGCTAHGAVIIPPPPPPIVIGPPLGPDVYYDGPFIIGGVPYWYYDGWFWFFEGGFYHRHHIVPFRERGWYHDHWRGGLERHREHFGGPHSTPHSVPHSTPHSTPHGHDGHGR